MMRTMGWVGMFGVLLVTAASAQEGERRPGQEVLEHTHGDSTGVLTLPADWAAAPTPFGPGERLEYQVKLGIFSVGDGYMEVSGVDTVRGSPAYHATMGLDAGIPLARVKDEFHTWFDIRNLVSHRFIQDVNEVSYHAFRHFEMNRDERRWERVDNGESGPLGSALPLDDISFVYFLRTMPLEVGKTYTLNRYFKDEGNPVVIEVVRRDRREVPAGTFNTIVVRPTIRTKGLFSEGGNAEIHFTDDDRRLMVYLRSEIPGFQSITLHLRNIQEGLPLNPDARAAAEARIPNP
ncbi:MAG: DUF3108 domain-containing protein [Gemmatimonadota bacterium]|nr:DUF3108 domain-containing protein [Gemmatimonadota bacterium]